VEKLTQIVSKENKMIKQIGELDHKRVEVTAQFMIAKGFKPNAKVTISDLSKIIFDVEEKKTLVGLQRKLLATIRGLRELNQLNQQLIEQSLAFIDYSMDVIVGPPEDEVVYQHPKLSGNGAKRSSLFDGKV
jgi:flagellar biosynthesis/type III secretory pathway chaperone